TASRRSTPAVVAATRASSSPGRVSVTRPRWLTSSSSERRPAVATVRTDAYQLPLPAGWSDRTAVTIVAPAAADGSVPNLVITREALCAGMGLAGFADGHANLRGDPVGHSETLSDSWVNL